MDAHQPPDIRAIANRCATYIADTMRIGSFTSRQHQRREVWTKALYDAHTVAALVTIADGLRDEAANEDEAAPYRAMLRHAEGVIREGVYPPNA